MLVLGTLEAGFGSALRYSYNVEWSTSHTRWAGENGHLALWKLPSSFQKSPSSFQKLLSFSDTPWRLASEDQGMIRVVPLNSHPLCPLTPHHRNVILYRHIRKGVGGDGHGFPTQSLWALVPLLFLLGRPLADDKKNGVKD